MGSHAESEKPRRRVSIAQNQNKQARKSSEDAQAAGYAQFDKVWAR